MTDRSDLVESRIVPDISVKPTDPVVFHEVLFTVHQPASLVYRRLLNMPPDVLQASPGVKGVSTTRMMRGTNFMLPGSRRLLRMTDENTLVEEVLEVETDKHFSSKSWHASLPVHELLEYETNHYWLTNQGSATMVRWRHNFKLHSSYLPLLLDSFRRMQFKRTYVARTYAPFMERAAVAIKEYVGSSRTD